MKNNKKNQEKLIDDYDYLSNAASSTDYTGKMKQNSSRTMTSASFSRRQNRARSHQNHTRIRRNNSTKQVIYCIFSLFLTSLDVIMILL